MIISEALCGLRNYFIIMPELLLHYIWEYRLWAAHPQFTTDGQSIEILSVGEHNQHAGPDYSHAHIRIGEREWVGNIEIHTSSSDWFRHKHHLDKAYDNIILHVVRKADKVIYNTQGEIIPQCELAYPTNKDYLTQLFHQAQHMDSATYRIGCAQQLIKDPNLITDGWRRTLLCKRLECKRASIDRLLEITNGSWEHALYISLARNFGFHTNSVPFEELAINTPLSYLQKHRNSLFQLTAILLGQAGFLEPQDTPDAEDDLRKEYAFMRTKFTLTPLDSSIWKHARMRPQNSPKVRIKQFAHLLYQSEFLLSKILDTNSINSLTQLIELQPTKKEEKVAFPLGKTSIDILLINTLIPYKYAYAMHRNKTNEAQQAIELMEQIDAEDNNIIRLWKTLGQEVNSAADSQALIHLYQQYCQHHGCINCEVGYKVFEEKQLKLF